MKLLLKFLIVIILFSINTPTILGQYKDANYIAYSQLGNVSLHNFDVLNRSKNEDETYLKDLFYPDTIPKTGIKVLENALGDVIKDSIVNIKDLLRLRDITIGRPPSITSYENTKADLNLDGMIDSKDLNILRDILLYRSNVPYLISSNGGQALGDGITITIPPNAVDSNLVISIRRISENEFSTENDIDIKEAENDEVYYMTSFEITTNQIDFKLPVGTEIELDEIPPCAYQGLNGLFAVTPDKDGDGRTELFLINELLVDDDSLTVRAADIAIPIIESLSASALEPGQSLTISGKGFGDDLQNIIVQLFPIIDDDSLQNLIPSIINDSTIVITVPDTKFGQFNLIVFNILSGVKSNGQNFEIIHTNFSSGDIREIILDFYYRASASLDSLNIDSIFTSIEDITVRDYYNYLSQSNREFINSEILYFTELSDSLIINYESYASFLLNLEQSIANKFVYENNSMKWVEDCTFCKPIEKSIKETKILTDAFISMYYNWVATCIEQKPYGLCHGCNQAEIYRKKVLEYTDQLAALYNLLIDCKCRLCPETKGCDKCIKTVYIGYGPQGQKISGGFDKDGFNVKGTCINIIRYKSNQCIKVPKPIGVNGSPVPLNQLSDLKCPSNKTSLLKEFETNSDIRPNPGSIIKVTNATVPYNIVGLLNDNGNAFIPQVPMNTTVTFSMYDPVTGFYDPNVGTYTTGSTPGGFDRPILLFMPNTDIRQIAMNVGEIKHDSISLNGQRIDYLLNIGPKDLNKLLNIAFSASSFLSLRVVDPDGNVIVNQMNLQCYSDAHIKINKAGTFLLRVAYGSSGQAGSFDLAVSYSPNKPLPNICLCGDVIVDTLFEELSPYEIKCSTNVLTNKSLTSEEGTILEFADGGIISVNGIFKGFGSQQKPIILKPQHTNFSTKEFFSIGRVKNDFDMGKEAKP